MEDHNHLNIEGGKPGLLASRLAQLNRQSFHFKPGKRIESEGASSSHLFLITEGRVEMLKRGKGGEFIRVDEFVSGDLIGLTSFWTKEPSFLESRAIDEVTCLRLNAFDVEQVAHEEPEVRDAMHRLFISNLSKRYRRMIALNVKVSELSDALEQERSDLEVALRDLTQTRNKLIHSEKLATLGQLFAGIAHEINNPCASLNSSVESVIRVLPGMMDGSRPGQEQAVRAGLESGFVDSELRRTRVDRLLESHPELPRSLARSMAELDEETFQKLGVNNSIVIDEAMQHGIKQQLKFHKLGGDLRSIRLSTGRIAKLVTSLKNYTRQDDAGWDMIDLREGIRDTLTVLNNQLRHYSVHLKLEPIDSALCIAGEMNQVWTNLLVNACQATETGGDIWISTGQDEGLITVEIADNGTGIVPAFLEKIFEMNFTTKTTKVDFGLGVGLSISKDIVEKHGGKITAANRPEGGAIFTVSLPTA